MQTVEVAGDIYEVTLASWESFSTVHDVDRRQLEAELDRAITADDVQPGFLAKHPSSYSSSWLPFYAVIEVLFLTYLLSAAAIALQRLRPTAVLPALCVLFATPLPFVFVYSPAFVDADWFYQRIVLETAGLYCIGLSGLLARPAAVSLVLWGALRTAERFADRRKASSESYRRRTLVALGVVAVLLLGLAMIHRHQEVAGCERALNAVGARLDPAVLTTIADDSALQQRSVNFLEPRVDSPGTAAIEALLRESEHDRDYEIRLFIPAREDDVLFLWRSTFVYADVRTLSANIIDYETIMDIQRTGQAQHEPWPGLSPPLCGSRWELGARPVVLLAKRLSVDL
jgi:hypothetical protein